MNSVNLIGRLTKNVELLTAGENKYIRFNLAVNRKFKNNEGEYDADFISCVAWNKTAELIAEHFGKGSEIGISGRIQTGSYEKEDGSKVYTTDIIVESITFIGSKKEGRPAPEYTGPEASESLEEKAEAYFGSEALTQKDALKNIPIDDSELPF